jgi:peptide methionine sulfoxide reductase msrA/msrB
MMMKKWLILSVGLLLGFGAMAQTQNKQKKMERALFASGCYWGTEYYLQQQEGVISTTVGYTGGHVPNPTYRQVCTGTTGHAETVEVIYDPEKTDYETLVKIFFNTHDPTQVNRQGPDIGEQYRSAIFYLSESQKETAEKIINVLEDKGYKVATELTKATEFYTEMDDKHQDYYIKTGGTPYCHKYTERFK